MDPDRPPGNGSLEFSVACSPVSSQAWARAKSKLRNKIEEVTRPLRYILFGEVSVEITWMLHERVRLESDESPDVDNILKPILDVLSGKHGIMIDDCQVQSISASWIDWPQEEQELRFRLQFLPHEFLARDGLVFVKVREALCCPVPMQIREKPLMLWVDHLAKAMELKSEVEAEGGFLPARTLVNPVFHRSRIKDHFTVMDIETLKEEAMRKSNGEA
jgi:Holliday junction resolvase RusA-like endonuclease